MAKPIFGGAKLLTDDLVAMNTALINGEIDAYFTGGTYTASPARFDGATQIRGDYAQLAARWTARAALSGSS